MSFPSGWPRLLVVLLALSLSSRVNAQNRRVPFEKIGAFTLSDRVMGGYRAPRLLGQPPIGAPVEVVHYDLSINLAMVSEYLSGDVTLTVRILAPTDSVILNSVALRLDSVFIDGSTAVVSYNPYDEDFVVRLGALRAPGDTVRVRIVYERSLADARPSSRRGYYYFTTAIGIPAELGYTMSEPSDARFWFPCLDEPWAKGTAAIHVTLPAGYVAASNGQLTGVKDNGNGTLTWNWNESHRVAPYLICVTASRFSVSTLPYVRATNDTVPLQYYTWGVDSVVTAGFLPTVRRMIDALSHLYGPYPFEKYGMTSVIPFAYGGMEHETITTLNEYLQVNPDVVVHEMGHQWWGDLITCGTWADVWLNEGFATYTEALWAGETSGPQGLTDFMMTQLLNLNRGSWQGAVYDPAGQGFNLFDDVVYSKAAWVLHTLRGVVGDSAFLRILHAYRQKFQESSATTSDFAGIVDSVTGSPMGWFFDQWIYGKGWPQLNTSYAWLADTLRLTIDQTQPPGWPVFRLPMVVRFSPPYGSSDIAIIDSLRTQTFSFYSPFSPSDVVVDPDHHVLKEIWGAASGGATQPTAYLLQNYPNPFNAGTRIQYGIPIRSTVSVRIVDILGREVATLVNEIQPARSYTMPFSGARLASGVYFCRLTASPVDGSAGTTVIRKMLIVR